jgi:UDP-glucuronate 4-epimerase
MQKGDVKETYADISNLSSITNYHPQTSIEEGIANFVNWYKEYYAIEIAQ